MEIMDEYRMAGIILMADVNGGRVWGRSRLGWMDRVEVALGSSWMTVESALKIGSSGEPWCIFIRLSST